MRKIRNILLLIVILCIIGTVNVYADGNQIIIQGDNTAKASELKTLEVKLQTDTDMRRSTV